MNTPSSHHAPRLLPSTESPPSLITFDSPEGFALPLLAFPCGDLQLTAFAEHRPTFPEFLGSGWHLPLDRILADSRHGTGQATLFLGPVACALRQTGWCGTETAEFAGQGIHRARFHLRENQWFVEHSEELVSVFSAAPKSAPRAWFRSEIRQRDELRFRFAYHHHKLTHLLELRDAKGYCARFEHSPLRGDSSQILLRAISVEGPQRSTLGRMQLSYALQPASTGHAAVLQSILVREQGAPPRSVRCCFEYFTARRHGSRPLKALSFGPHPARLFVPGLDANNPLPHAASHPSVPDQTSIRAWHEEQLTLIAEQFESRGSPSARFTIYSRGQLARVNRCTLRRCRLDLDAAVCRISGDRALLAVPNQLAPGNFEILLWQWKPAAQRWISYRRIVQANSLEFLPPDADGLGLQILRDADPHTCYRLHWFDRPRAWSLTSIVPAGANPANPGRLKNAVAPAEPDQDALFARRSLPPAVPESSQSALQTEDHIQWQPGELFAGLQDAPDLALIA